MTTVKELIEELSLYDDENLEVRYVYDYGDHNHSMIAGEINDIQLQTIRYSGYHGKDILCEEVLVLSE